MDKSFALVFVVLFLTSLVTVPFANSTDTKTSWTVQTLNDENAWAGGYCPIVVDPNDTVHIAYMAFPNGTNSLIYTSYNGSLWTNQTVVATGYVFVVFSLVLDVNGNPHILFDTSPRGSPIDPLVIASWNGRNWDIQNTGINYASYATLAVDSLGTPHIAYTTGIFLKYGDTWIGNELNYASWTGTDWNIQTIESSMTDSFSAVSLQLSGALNSKNTPYILYSLSSNSSNIKLATYENSSWNIKSVTLPRSAGNFGNVVVDSKGYPHFIYTQLDQNTTNLSTILYASFNGTVWDTQIVASKVSMGYGSSIGELVLDLHDYPHFIYSISDEETMYAAYSGTAWNIQTLPSNIAAGNLALDAKGNPHLSYRTYSWIRWTANLMYATATETTLSPTTPMLTASVAQMLIIFATVTVLVVVIASLLLFRRHRKTVRLNQ